MKCFVAVVGLFFTAGAANADIVADVGGIGFFLGYVRCIGVRWTGVDWMIKSE